MSKTSTRSRLIEAAPDAITNVTLALSALDRLGGAERFVDIEEVALEAFALAPDRFSWRTRRDLPSWERVRTAFVHANQKEQRRGGRPLVIGNTDGTAWRQTAEGVAFVRKHAEKVENVSERARRPRRSGRSAERVRQIRRHPAFATFMHGTAVSSMESYQLADILLCPPDSPANAVGRKVDTAKAAAIDAGDEEVKRFLDEVETEVNRRWS